MKSRILRALGVGAALLVPLGGLTFLGAGTVGATTHPQLTFTSSNKMTVHIDTFIYQEVTVPLQLATGYGNTTGSCTSGTKGTVTLSGNSSDEGYNVLMFTNSGWSLCMHIPAGKLKVTNTTRTVSLVATATGAKGAYMTLAGASCAVYTTSNITLHRTGGLTTTFKKFTVSPTPATLGGRSYVYPSATPPVACTTSVTERLTAFDLQSVAGSQEIKS